MKLSDQVLEAVMMALQKSLLEQSDMVPALKDFELQEQEGELAVTNPPSVNFGRQTKSEKIIKLGTKYEIRRLGPSI